MTGSAEAPRPAPRHSDSGSLEAAGHESHAELLGIFQVSVLHNVVHLLFGAAGIALARRPPTTGCTSCWARA